MLDLTEGRVPSQVFHAAAELPMAEAEVLGGRALDVITEVAARRIRELLAEIGPVDAIGVVAGDRPVPESVSAILASHVLMHAAEGQIYRDALLDAAASLGVPGIELARKDAAARLAGDLAATILALGVVAGPPWRKEHKLAAVAAISAATAFTVSSGSPG